MLFRSEGVTQFTYASSGKDDNVFKTLFFCDKAKLIVVFHRQTERQRKEEREREREEERETKSGRERDKGERDKAYTHAQTHTHHKSSC